MAEYKLGWSEAEPLHNRNNQHSPKEAKDKNTYMASTLVKNDIHLTFHVKSTSVKIQEADLGRLFSYVGGIIQSINGVATEVGGMPDHLHILCSLPKTISLADFVRIIKAESSKWMKQLDRTYMGFEWQEGYGAFSVSPSLIEKTVKYIRNQAEHHKRTSFREEYQAFLQACGISYDERYAFGD